MEKVYHYVSQRISIKRAVFTKRGHEPYPRQIDVLTHISPFWRTSESNDTSLAWLTLKKQREEQANGAILIPQRRQ